MDDYEKEKPVRTHQTGFTIIKKVFSYFFTGEEYLAFSPSRISLVMLYMLSA